MMVGVTKQQIDRGQTLKVMAKLVFLGEADAAVDPLADPEVREAVNRASFELLVGFQLDEAQLAYNATR